MNQLKILAVVCHPADAIDGAGGMLCLHAERGDDVTIVVCTHGVESHDLRRNDAVCFATQSAAITNDAKQNLPEPLRDVAVQVSPDALDAGWKLTGATLLDPDEVSQTTLTTANGKIIVPEVKVWKVLILDFAKS